MAFLASNAGMIGGSFARDVHQGFFPFASQRIGELLGIASMTPNALEARSILKRYDATNRRCSYQDS
jgi:hypothetical protein